MRCSNCQSDSTYIIDSREYLEESYRRRRYQCENCSQRFTTYEVPAVQYERAQILEAGLGQLDSTIITLQEIKTKLGESNGHRKD